MRADGDDACAGAESRGLPGGEYDVAVVGEDEDRLRGGAPDRPDEVLDRRVHALAALDDGVAAELAEGLRYPGSRGDRDGAVALFVIELRDLEAVRDRRAVLLERHVLDLESEELSVLLGLVQYVARTHGVNVYLEHAAVAEGNDRTALPLHPFYEPRGIEVSGVAGLALLQPEQELGAVARSQDVILGEGGQIWRFPAGVGREGLGRRDKARERLAHSLDDIKKTGSAAVDDSRLLEHREQLGRVLERTVHLRREVVGERLDGARPVQPVGGVFHRFAVDGEDGALHRLRDGPVGLGDASLEGSGEPVNVGALHPLEALRDAVEDPGEDHSRVASRPEEHPARREVRRPVELRRPLLQHLGARVDRHVHVVAGIAVRDREYVQLVHDAAVASEDRSPVPHHFRVDFSVDPFSGHI